MTSSVDPNAVTFERLEKLPEGGVEKFFIGYGGRKIRFKEQFSPEKQEQLSNLLSEMSNGVENYSVNLELGLGLDEEGNVLHRFSEKDLSYAAFVELCQSANFRIPQFRHQFSRAPLDAREPFKKDLVEEKGVRRVLRSFDFIKEITDEARKVEPYGRFREAEWDQLMKNEKWLAIQGEDAVEKALERRKFVLELFEGLKAEMQPDPNADPASREEIGKRTVLERLNFDVEPLLFHAAFAEVSLEQRVDFALEIFHDDPNYAKEVALAGIFDRREYHEACLRYELHPRKDSPELFFMKMISEHAEGREDFSEYVNPFVSEICGEHWADPSLLQGAQMPASSSSSSSAVQIVLRRHQEAAASMPASDQHAPPVIRTGPAGNRLLDEDA